MNGSVTPSVTTGVPSGSRSIEPLDQLLVERVRDAERRDDREQADDEPLPQLGQVLDEGRFLVVAQAPRQDPAGHRAA